MRQKASGLHQFSLFAERWISPARSAAPAADASWRSRAPTTHARRLAACALLLLPLPPVAAGDFDTVSGAIAAFAESSGPAEIDDAAARELTVFAGHLGPTVIADATAREFTVFATDEGNIFVNDAVSREFTVFVTDEGHIAVNDAVSREFSILAAIAETPPVTDSVAREFSVQVPTPPAILLADSVLSYVEGDGDVPIDAGARVIDPDSPHFGGGALLVTILEGASADDQISILGNAAEEPSISLGEGGTVLYGADAIGTHAGGSNGEPLTISLTSNATLSAAEALVRSIAFSNSRRFPAGGARVVRFVLSDPDAGAGPPATREIMVIPVNHAPIAGPDFLGARHDSPLTFSEEKLLANDSDPDGDPIHLSIPKNATVKDGRIALADGTVTYTPPEGFTGTDRFEYTLSDPYGGVSTGIVTVFVRAQDDPSVSVLKVEYTKDGVISMRVVGLPDRDYEALASQDLHSWIPVGTIATDGIGHSTFLDPDAFLFDRRFYKFRFPL